MSLLEVIYPDLRRYLASGDGRVGTVFLGRLTSCGGFRWLAPKCQRGRLRNNVMVSLCAEA